MFYSVPTFANQYNNLKDYSCRLGLKLYQDFLIFVENLSIFFMLAYDWPLGHISMKKQLGEYCLTCSISRTVSYRYEHTNIFFNRSTAAKESKNNHYTSADDEDNRT